MSGNENASKPVKSVQYGCFGYTAHIDRGCPAFKKATWVATFVRFAQGKGETEMTTLLRSRGRGIKINASGEGRRSRVSLGNKGRVFEATITYERSRLPAIGAGIDPTNMSSAADRFYIPVLTALSR